MPRRPRAARPSEGNAAENFSPIIAATSSCRRCETKPRTETISNRAMAMLVHEIWEDVGDDGSVLPGLCLAGPDGEAFRKLYTGMPGAPLGSRPAAISRQ